MTFILFSLGFTGPECADSTACDGVTCSGHGNCITNTSSTPQGYVCQCLERESNFRNILFCLRLLIPEALAL